MERRACEPTYTFITTRKREEEKKKKGKKTWANGERERENLHENTESFEERFP